MAPMANGRVQIQYRQVPCTPPANMNIEVDANSGSGGWLRLTIQVHSRASSASQSATKHACIQPLSLCTFQCHAMHHFFSGWNLRSILQRLLRSPAVLLLQEVGNFGNIRLVEVQGQNSGWQSMNNVYGAAWEIANAPPPPLNLRITDANGNQVQCLQSVFCRSARIPTSEACLLVKAGTSCYVIRKSENFLGRLPIDSRRLSICRAAVFP